MKCGDAKTFLFQVQNGGPVSAPVGPSDLAFLSSNGYINLMTSTDYDKTKADVATLDQLSQTVQREQTEIYNTQADLNVRAEKSHSFSFHFQSGDAKQTEYTTMQTDRDTIARDQADITMKENTIAQLIQRKSYLDRLVPYNGQYVSVTGQGLLALHDLTIRNYRLSDSDIKDFAQESIDTNTQLRSIAANAGYYVGQLKNNIVLYDSIDSSQMWSVALGLAKLQGNQMMIGNRFLQALNLVWHFDSTVENRMMAAEIMTSFQAQPSQANVSQDNSDLKGLSDSLKQIDHDIRHHAHVPGQLSVGVASTILSGKRFDGSFPEDRFTQFSKLTLSWESAGILSVLNVPSDQLLAKFQAYRSLFSSWGYEVSEDTELSSAYLAISDLNPDDVKTKMVILLEALHNYLEYPIVAAAILATVPTLEANETLDLMEKAYAILQPYANLERSELVSLAVRMIHGIKNELVKQLDPTAKLYNTPVQFTYAPGYWFFIYHRPLIIAHSSYYSTFSGIGGAHPAHVHGYGGGGFGG